MKRFIPFIVLLLVVSFATVTVAQDEGEFYSSSSSGSSSLKRVGITFLSTGTQFLVDEWRNNTFSFGMGMTMSLELNACPGLSAVLQVKVLYLNLWTSFEVVPFTLGLKLRFPLGLDSGSWYDFSGDSGLKGFTPYIRISGGPAYAGAFGDPTNAGWFEYARYRESTVAGGAVGFQAPISKTASLFLELDYFALMAPHELPVNFLGPIAGVTFVF